MANITHRLAAYINSSKATSPVKISILATGLMVLVLLSVGGFLYSNYSINSSKVSAQVAVPKTTKSVALTTPPVCKVWSANTADKPYAWANGDCGPSAGTWPSGYIRWKTTWTWYEPDDNVCAEGTVGDSDIIYPFKVAGRVVVSWTLESKNTLGQSSDTASMTVSSSAEGNTCKSGGSLPTNTTINNPVPDLR